MTRGLSDAALVVRFDDVRTLGPRLERIWNVMERRGVPLHLEVVPAWLDEAAADRIAERARRCDIPVAVHQHGAAHVNHGTPTRRFEFGDSRGLEPQLADIRKGREVLEARLPDLFEPVFSPPWNRYGASTLEALALAEFVAFSSAVRPGAPTQASVACVPMTLDPVQWRPSPKHQPWEDIQLELATSLEREGFAGLELHIEVMTEDDVEGLDLLLAEFVRRGVRFPTMRSVVERGQHE